MTGHAPSAGELRRCRRCAGAQLGGVTGEQLGLSVLSSHPARPLPFTSVPVTS